MNADRYPEFVDLVALLPDVHAVMTLGALRDERDAAIAGETLPDQFLEVGASIEALEEVLHAAERDGEAVTTVSPTGARLLASLYRTGWMPKTPRGRVGAVPEAFEAYARGETDVLAELQARADERRAHQRRLGDLSAWPPSDFTFSLLQQLFARHHAGRGEGRLMIGAVEVERKIPNPGLIPHANHYHWVGEDGLLRHATHLGIVVSPP